MGVNSDDDCGVGVVLSTDKEILLMSGKSTYRPGSAEGARIQQLQKTVQQLQQQNSAMKQAFDQMREQLQGQPEGFLSKEPGTLKVHRIGIANGPGNGSSDQMQHIVDQIVADDRTIIWSHGYEWNGAPMVCLVTAPNWEVIQKRLQVEAMQAALAQQRGGPRLVQCQECEECDPSACEGDYESEGTATLTEEM